MYYGNGVENTMNKKVSILGAPTYFGASIGGVDLGPYVVRYGGMSKQLTEIGIDFVDLGDISLPSTNNENYGIVKQEFSNEVIDICKNIASTVENELEKGHFPLVLGGDHSIAIGTVTGILRKIPRLGVIWFDAHGDANTFETSISGNIHGMSLAILLGYGNEKFKDFLEKETKIDPKNIVQIGIRDLDPGEEEFLKNLGVTIFTAEDVRKQGIKSIMEKAIKILNNNTDAVHLTFDLDALDPEFAPGGGLAVPHGLSLDDTKEAIDMLRNNTNLVAAEFTEINPILDKDNITVNTTIELITELLSKKVTMSK